MVRGIEKRPVAAGVAVQGGLSLLVLGCALVAGKWFGLWFGPAAVGEAFVTVFALAIGCCALGVLWLLFQKTKIPEIWWVLFVAGIMVILIVLQNQAYVGSGSFSAMVREMLFKGGTTYMVSGIVCVYAAKRGA